MVSSSATNSSANKSSAKNSSANNSSATNSSAKKELQLQYKERDVVGGVYLIRNLANNKLFLDASADLHGCRNRFNFAQSSGSSVYLKLQKDWETLGSGQFAFEVLEELKKSENQSHAEFKSELSLLKELWHDKLSGENFY